MFRFLMIFQLIFAYGVRLFSLPYPIVPSWFDEKTILSPLIYLGIFAKTQWTMYGMIYFWTFYSVYGSICLSLYQYHTC